VRYCSIFLLLLFVSCASHVFDPTSQTNQPPVSAVESFETVATTKINKTIEEAVVRGELWPFSPALIAFKILGGDRETRTYAFTQEADRAENPDTVVSVLIRDGFLDDSVRGDWHELTLSTEPDNSWRISKLHKAFRCWRQDADFFHSGPCP